MLHNAIFPATCNATMTNEKHCKLRWTCYTQQLVSQRCEKQRIVLLFLQLATQHFVALQVAKIGCYMGNCFRNLQCNVCCAASYRKSSLVQHGLKKGKKILVRTIGSIGSLEKQSFYCSILLVQQMRTFPSKMTLYFFKEKLRQFQNRHYLCLCHIKIPTTIIRKIIDKTNRTALKAKDQQ